MNKKMKIIFTLSLVTNIFLIGGVGGYVFRAHNDAQHPWSALKERLAPETRVLMKETFIRKKPEVKEFFKEAREKQKALADAFSAAEFDVEAYDEAARDLMQTGAKISQHKVETFKVLGQKLPQSERAHLAKSLAENLLGRHGRKHGRSNYKKFRKERESTEK